MNFNIFNIIRAAILFVALIFVCVGTGVKWFTLESDSFQLNIFVYGVSAIVGGFKSELVTIKDYFPCDAMASRFDAAYAFAIISCLIVGACLVAVALQFFLAAFEKILKFTSLGLAIAGFVSTLITFAIGAGVYNGKFCDMPASMNELDISMVAGVPLFIVAWVLMIADTAVAAYTTFFGAAAVPEDSKEPSKH